MKQNIHDYVWHGLKGRYAHAPNAAGKRTNIVLVYGQHASLERNAGITGALALFGDVWSPDMPGFGGMDSFYKIHKKPTVDNYADYLYDFITQHIKDEPLVLVGISYGFANVTRLLQKYPNLQQRVLLVVSFVGFTSADDFNFKPKIRGQAVRVGAKISRNVVVANFFKVMAHLQLFDTFYRWQLPRPQPYDRAAKAARRAIVKNKGDLWRLNDRRTHAFTAYEFIFELDMRHTRIPMPVHHLGVAYDHYFDHDLVLQHMEQIYDKAINYNLNLPNHSPAEDANTEQVLATIPKKMLDILGRLP